MRLLRKGLVLLTALALAACGETAAPVNVEATVQARVSATVGAAQRAQATATRPPGTAVVPIGTAGTPGGTGTPATTAAGTAAGTPAGTGTPGTPGTTGTPSGTGTPLRTSTPGGTTTAVGTGTAGAVTTVTPVGSPGATPPPPLALGAFARFGGFSATVTRYEWSATCPGGTGRASAGRKYVLLQAAGRNDGSGALSPPSVVWAVESAPAGASLPCRPEGQSFEEACARAGVLPAAARCEGWLLFEVPESLEVPGALVTARVAGPQVTPGPATQDVGRWRLPA